MTRKEEKKKPINTNIILLCGSTSSLDPEYFFSPQFLATLSFLYMSNFLRTIVVPRLCSNWCVHRPIALTRSETFPQLWRYYLVVENRVGRSRAVQIWWNIMRGLWIRNWPNDDHQLFRWQGCGKPLPVAQWSVKFVIERDPKRFNDNVSLFCCCALAPLCLVANPDPGSKNLATVWFLYSGKRVLWPSS